MIDFTKPVQTRDGRAVRILATDRNGYYPIVALVTDFNGREVVVTYDTDGREYADHARLRDLVNVPEKRSIWVNVYADGNGYAFRTKDEADRVRHRGRIACIELTYDVPTGEQAPC